MKSRTIFYSLLFLILKNELEKQEKQKMIDLLESYVIRRGVCGLTSKNYNQLVANICQAIFLIKNYLIT